MVGEHTLNTSPDCRKSGDFCLPENQTLAVEKVIKHPRWNIKEFFNGYDIALVRVKGHISLFVSLSSFDDLSCSWEPTRVSKGRDFPGQSGMGRSVVPLSRDKGRSKNPWAKSLSPQKNKKQEKEVLKQEKMFSKTGNHG